MVIGKKKAGQAKATKTKLAARKRTEECNRLEEEIEKLIKQSPDKKASIREICDATHIAAEILIYHVRIRNEKGLVHLEEHEGPIGLDTVISIEE
jgi:hypothetical protein